MFALVNFEDGIPYVCPVTDIKKREVDVTVKYKNGARYNATVHCVNESYTVLTDIQKNISRGSPYVDLHRINIVSPPIQKEYLESLTSLILHQDVKKSVRRELFPTQESNNGCGQGRPKEINFYVKDILSESASNQCTSKRDQNDLDEDNLENLKQTVLLVDDHFDVNSICDSFLPEKHKINSDLSETGAHRRSIIQESIDGYYQSHPEETANTSVKDILLENYHTSKCNGNEFENATQTILLDDNNFDINSICDGFLLEMDNINSHIDESDGHKRPIKSNKCRAEQNFSLYTEESNNSCQDHLEEIENIEDILLEISNNHYTSKNDENELENTNLKLLDDDSFDLGETDDNRRSIKSKKYGTKQNFCLYCKKLNTKIARHLEYIHKDEEVQKLIFLPKGSKERKQIIETIRRQGNFLHNTNPLLNTNKIIVARRPNENKARPQGHYKPCPNCKGFFSVLSLRRHYRYCKPDVNEKGNRNILILSRRIQGTIHKNASPILRNVFSVLREDKVTNIIRYDELAIIYGNKMCAKYRDHHHYPMIRARLRVIGRFIIEIKKLCEGISDFASVFRPKFYNFAVQAINSVAGLNECEGQYAAPATAFSLGTALKYNANILIGEYIKKEDRENKRLVDEFLKLLCEDLPTSVNKTVAENQLQQKRQKKIILPTTTDIKKLITHLQANRQKYYNCLSHNVFSYEAWIHLCRFTLTSIQVFNRRRSGEIERMYISDFQNLEKVSEDSNDEIYNFLTKEEALAAKKYVRILIRGKLARGVPVLLDIQMVNCVNCILQHREEANVPRDNPYIFGVPGKSKTFQYLRACNLLREYSKEVGASNPSTLRGTQLRKHIATHSTAMKLSQEEVEGLQNFMGHGDKIHREHYRMPVVNRDISRMSRILEIGVGKVAQGNGPLHEHSEEADENEKRVIQSTTEKNVVQDETGENEKINQGRTVNKESYDHEEFHEIDGSDNEKMENKETRKRIRLMSNSMGSIRRVPWATPERHCIKAVFQENITSGKLPSLKMCTKAVRTKFELKNRSAAQVKMYIHNEIQKKDTKNYLPCPKCKAFFNRDNLYKHKKKYGTQQLPAKSIQSTVKGTLEHRLLKATARRWTTPEKLVCRKVFRHHLDRGVYPSKEELWASIHTFAALKHRTPRKLKSHLQHEMMLLKKQE